MRYDPESFQAEWFSTTNRWLFTIVPEIFCAVFLWLAWFTPVGAGQEDSGLENGLWAPAHNGIQTRGRSWRERTSVQPPRDATGGRASARRAASRV